MSSSSSRGAGHRSPSIREEADDVRRRSIRSPNATSSSRPSGLPTSSPESSAQETIDRYIGRVDRPARRRTDQRVRAGARAPLRPRAAEGARPGGRDRRQGAAGGAVRLRPQRRPQPDGRRPREAALRGAHPRPLGRIGARRRRSTRPSSRRCEELGVDMSEEFPKPLTDEVVRAADVVITMGCGDACPIYPGKKYEDWELDDPAGQDLETVRRIRDEIDQRVQKLIGELLPEHERSARLSGRSSTRSRGCWRPSSSAPSRSSSPAAARSWSTRRRRRSATSASRSPSGS